MSFKVGKTWALHFIYFKCDSHKDNPPIWFYDWFDYIYIFCSGNTVHLLLWVFIRFFSSLFWHVYPAFVLTHFPHKWINKIDAVIFMVFILVMSIYYKYKHSFKDNSNIFRNLNLLTSFPSSSANSVTSNVWISSKLENKSSIWKQ